MTYTVHTTRAHADTAIKVRASGVAPAVAIAATAAFAGGGLLTQTVIVPAWRAMDPAAFLAHFGTAGPATGATLFPIEVAAVLLLGRVTYSAFRNRGSRPVAWAAATGCMVATLLLLPIYFAGANRAMLDTGFPPQAVADELTTWYGWNWLRTGLALLATACACTAVRADETSTSPGPA